MLDILDRQFAALREAFAEESEGLIGDMLTMDARQGTVTIKITVTLSGHDFTEDADTGEAVESWQPHIAWDIRRAAKRKSEPVQGSAAPGGMIVKTSRGFELREENDLTLTGEK